MNVDAPPELIGFTAEQRSFFDRGVPPEIGLLSYRIAGPLVEGRLRCAVSRLTDHYPSLRARVTEAEGRAEQRIADCGTGGHLVVAPIDSMDEARGVAERTVLEPMDLEHEGPIRVIWHPITNGDSVLTIAIAHPWADASAMETVGRALFEFYAIESTESPVTVEMDLPDGPADIPDQMLRHVQEQMLRIPAVVDDVIDVDRNPFRAEYLRDEWGIELVEAVVDLAAATRSTVPVVVLAVLALAIGEVASVDELMVMTSMTTRKSDPEGRAPDAPVGYFQSIAPVRIALHGHETLADLIAHTQFRMLSTMVHTRPPYSYASALRALADDHDDVAELLLRLWRSRSGPPTLIPLYNPVPPPNLGVVSADAGSVEVEPLQLLAHYSPCTLFDLMCVPQIVPAARSVVRFHYHPRLVPDAVVRKLAASMRTWAALDLSTKLEPYA